MEIHCFDTLSEGLSSFNKLKPLPTFPTDDEIKEITEEELNSSSIHNFISGSASTNGSSSQIIYQSPNGPQGLKDLTSFFGPQGPQSLIHLFGSKRNED